MFATFADCRLRVRFAEGENNAICCYEKISASLHIKSTTTKYTKQAIEKVQAKAILHIALSCTFSIVTWRINRKSYYVLSNGAF